MVAVDERRPTLAGVAIIAEERRGKRKKKKKKSKGGKERPLPASAHEGKEWSSSTGGTAADDDYDDELEGGEGHVDVEAEKTTTTDDKRRRCKGGAASIVESRPSSVVTEKSSSSSSPDAPPRNDTFASIRPPLSPSVLAFLSSPPYDFQTPTPVQSTTIPLFLTHRDVLVRAVTGSGKTLAFLVPIVEMILRRTSLLRRDQIGGLILEPTRELARQTHGVCADLCSAVGMAPPLLLVGGGTGGGGGGGRDDGPGAASSAAAVRDLRRFAELRSDVVIGTPGRVEDVLTRYDGIDVSELEVLVLDESDVLLDMGFEVAITSILGRLPRMRRTGLFSATNTSGVRRLCVRSGMRNPVVVDVEMSGPVVPRRRPGGENDDDKDDDGRLRKEEEEEKEEEGDDDVAANARDAKRRRQATPSSLTNYYLICPLDEKLSRLASFLSQHPNDKVIVFFLTCACVEYYGSVLRGLRPPCKGYEYVALHGRLAQGRRERAMEAFRGGTGGPDDVVGGDGGGPSTAMMVAGRALLCTDVASRGLDVPDVSWTVQFDAPVDPSSYVHRVGRSARAGREGNSLVFLTRKEEAYVDFLRLRKVPVRELPDTEVCKPPSIEEEEEEGGANGNDREKEEEGSSFGEGKDGEDWMDAEEADEKPSDERDITSINEPASKSVDSRLSSATTKRMIKSAAGPDVFVPDILPSILKLVLKDRDILEKGTKAYTSYIRAYKEHHCAFIFRFASLDLGLLAKSFSLLRLPKMPELRDKKLNFVPAGPEVNIHAIPFKDKARESARKKRLAAELAAGGKNAKQIKAEQRAAERIAKSKERKAAEIAKGRNPHRKKGKQARIFDEWDELAREERLYKKLRTKKITKEDYDRLMYGGDNGSGGAADEGSDGDSD